MKPVLQSTMKVMKKKLFRHVEVKAPNNNFQGIVSVTFVKIAYPDIYKVAKNGPLL